MRERADHNRSWLRRISALIGAPLRRRLRADPLLAGTFVLVILVTSTAVAAVPTILTQVGDRGLVHALENAMVIQRGIALDFEGRIPAPAENPLAPVAERGEQYRENLPETLSSVIVDTQWVTDSPRYYHLYDDLTVPRGAVERYFQFRNQSDLNEHIELIDGREPRPAETVLLSEVAELDESTDDREIRRYEVMIGEETAETMELALGDQFVILADRQDRRNHDAPRSHFLRHIAVEVVGIFRPTKPESDYWYRDSRTYRTDVSANPDQTIYYSMGVPAPEVFPELLGLNAPGAWRYGWRYFVDPQRFDMAAANRTASDLQSINQNFGPYTEIADLETHEAIRQLDIRTMLPTLLFRAERQYNLTSAVLSLVVAGILTIGVALSGLLGALVAGRRTPEIALMRSRGASPRQVSVSQITEGLILALPAAVVGVAIASVVAGRFPPILSIAGAAVVAIAGVLSMWGLTRRIWTVDLGSLIGRRADVPSGSSQRRIVVEFLIVGLALAGIVLLRQRGVTTTAAREGFDPYIAAVPVLSGIAVGILAVRSFPWMIRRLASFAGRRPDIVPFLGLRRIAEPSIGRHLPLVVMILALGMAVFAGSIWYSIETPESLPVEEMTEEEIAETTEVPAGVNEAFQQGITQGFLLTLGLAGFYAGLAVVCALALTAEERRRDVGYLRTLGASRDQALGLTLIEQIPSTILAGAIGAVFGALLTWLIAPGLDIASLYPPETPVVIGVNWLLVVGQALGLIVVAVGSAVAFAYLARRTDLTDVLRAGE